MSNKNPGKKNKVKLEKAAAEKAAADRKKAKKTATKEQKAEIRAEDRKAKQAVREKEKKSKDRKKSQKAAEKEKFKQMKKDYAARLDALEERRKAAAEAEEDEQAEEVRENGDAEVSEDRLAEEENSGFTADESEDDGGLLCICCGDNPAQEGSELCEDCEEMLLGIHLPIRGFILALVSIIFSFFVLIIMGLTSSSAIQIAKGDYYMDKKNYNTAFTVYDDVAGILSTINENFGDDSIFTKIVATGSTFDIRAMECASKMYGPLDAIQSFDSNIFTSDGAYYFKKYSPKYKRINSYSEDFSATVTAVEDVLTEFSNDESDLTLDDFDKTYVPKLEAYSGKEGVNNVYLQYIIAYFAESYFSSTNEQLLKYVEKVDEAAKADGGDYSWLYYELYTTLLVETGETGEKTTSYLMEMMENDVSNYYSRIQMCRILVSRGKTEEAAQIANEYQANNVIDDDYTENAYALLIYMYRAMGNYEQAISTATSALDVYTYVPEIRRQQAMAYMSMGYYAEAFDAAYQASTDANYISSYYAISDFDGTLIDETLYIAAYLAKDEIQDDEDALANYEDVMATYSSADYVPAFAQKIIDGKIDVKKALTEGTCDFI